MPGIGEWAVNAGLTGMREIDILRGVCQRLTEAGLPLTRANLVMDTLHPLHEGRLFLWRPAESGREEIIEVGHVESRRSLREVWLRSPFYHVRQSGLNMMRWRLGEPDADAFTVFTELREEGHTDYAILVERFTEAGAIGEMDCIMGSWATSRPEGFADDELEALARLFPVLALAVKSSALQRIAGTLVETYLGRDAGRRVLSGRIERGIADRMRAVIWFSDLRGFTRITDTAAPEAIIPFLNAYADAIVSSIHDAGGDVLKLIGDGTLAVFHAQDASVACGKALEAANAAHARIDELNAQRSSEGLPVTEAYLGLHIGDVFYGNIGSSDRLDFTVIGPAVNMASRISVMCRSVERNILMSSAFMAEVPAEARNGIVSVGRFALRGFDQGQELYTILAAPPDEDKDRGVA